MLLYKIHIEEVAISGGLAFEVESKVIFPSCCCGLEGWRKVLEAVLLKKEVWLGHDPYPTLEFTNKLVRVWSDDYSGTFRKDLSEQDLQKVFYIEYVRDDLMNKLQAIETDFLEFYHHSLEKALYMIDDNLKESLLSQYCRWFDLNLS
ncbi:hypothetical protein [Paenibacillus radicis (ex Gao et al. 2016)]|uniref:Uncharacterized protein n=1 Tax=Paenibacillus radicis (ex Gao et al. 2016) TaxID=1737354 RepID=A0A917LS36_9BACL|nr:hypothetical protein [Paenibacillus radicis (ex Gao et al. 2016)]GGG53257.1 hypothetical protein GCM10010918_02410 [Paenibacillus radicis (ex Gao et al. 2016)]